MNAKISRHVCFWALGFAFMTGLTSAMAAPNAQPGFTVGIQTHLTTRDGLDLLQKTGVQSVRDDLLWSKVELQKGVLVIPKEYDDYVQALLDRGMEPLLILCYGNKLYGENPRPVSDEAIHGFANFAQFVVQHFKGKVRLFEVWNEWNNTTSMPKGTLPGEPEAYVKLLRATYPAMKSANPQALVIGGVIAGMGADHWLERACRADLLEHLDALSFHPYCYRAGEGKPPPEADYLWAIRQVRKIVSEYHLNKKIDFYITEIGWPAWFKPNWSDSMMADYLARAILLARAQPEIKGVWWYDWRDDGMDLANTEYNFGIVAHDLTPKPQYFAFQDVIRLLSEADYQGEDPASDGKIKILRFATQGGDAVFVFWSLDNLERRFFTIGTSGGGTPPQARLRLCGHGETDVPWRAGKDGKMTLHVAVSSCPRFLYVTAKDPKAAISNSAPVLSFQ